MEVARHNELSEKVRDDYLETKELGKNFLRIIVGTLFNIEYVNAPQMYTYYIVAKQLLIEKKIKIGLYIKEHIGPEATK